MAATYTSFVTSTPVLDATSEALGSADDDEYAWGETTARADVTTRILTIGVASDDAELAARIANTLAASLASRVAAATTATETGRLTVIEPAVAASSPIRPRPIRDAALAALAGLGVSLASPLASRRPGCWAGAAVSSPTRRTHDQGRLSDPTRCRRCRSERTYDPPSLIVECELNTVPPDVTVIIPTRNRWKLLRRTLGGVLRQDRISLEVIVVDDCSTDETALELARLTDPRVQVIRNAERRGVAAARNLALDAASGTWTAFLDDDDLWAPSKLHVVLDAARRTSGARWAYSAAAVVNEATEMLQLRPAPGP